MDKETLIKIILSDLSEVETMVKSFQGIQDIPNAFITLTEQKLEHIKNEFSLLKSLPVVASTPLLKSDTKETTANMPKEEPLNTDSVLAFEPADKKEALTPEPTELPLNEMEEEIIQDITVNNIQPVESKTADNSTLESENKDAIYVEAAAAEQTIVTEKKEERTDEKNKTIGETFLVEKKSVNDLISSSQESKKSLMGKPVSDLTKSLGINDRFLFQRELFNGKSDVMQQTLQQLNEMPDFNSAKSFIASNFNWNNELEATQSFFNYIKRKFY